MLVPTRGSVAAELVSALMNNTDGYDVTLRMVNRLPVDAARNRLAELAVAAADDIELFSRADDPYVFWIDSDAFFIKGTFTLMVDALERDRSISMLAALFGPRASDRGATAFRDVRDRTSYLVPGVGFQRGELVDVDAVGMHLVLHRVSLLRALGAHPFGTENDRMLDDEAFCGRIKILGGRIVVATGIPVFHVDERNGSAYTPGMPGCVVDGDQISTETIGAELPVENRTYGPHLDRVLKERRRKRR